MPTISRRQFLGAAATAAAATAIPMEAARAATPGRTWGLHDIEHVVILMQENRSFDHYFGTLRGVRGFADPYINREPGQSVLYQLDPLAVRDGALLPYVAPWHFDTRRTSAQEWGGLSHAWSAQHGSWNGGVMDGFVAAHRVIDDAVDSLAGGHLLTDNAPGTMAYFTRADLPFHYALADAFTVCDAYHASVQGPTNPNRIMFWSATVDPDGAKGGPCLDNSQVNGQLRWTSYPERLQAHGIDWYVYQEDDNFGDNMLPLFRAFANTKTDLYRRGNSFIPTPKGQPAGPALAARLKHDVVTGNLPQVSWIVGSYLNSEHPAATPAYGAHFVNLVLDALTADPKVWAKTVLFVNFDENDGFFDHVTPPTAPPGTPGEYVTAETALKNVSATDGFAGPVGLSFRVPMTVISPFTRGGLVCSDLLDHTSTLLFLERRFGVEVPNLSTWRRHTVGDLTSAFNFAAGPDLSVPRLPDTAALVGAADHQATLPGVQPPSQLHLPSQEPGPTRRHPSGII